MSDVTERGIRRNFVLLAIDYVSFGVGMTFLGPTTILPSLVRLLGGGAVAVGALSAIQMGGWVLPQFFMGRYVANRPLVKKYVVWPAIISRICLALAPVLLLLYAVSAPQLALAAFVLAYTAFLLTDAVGGVGWFDLLAKTVPLEQRGRAMGIAQSLSSLAAMGVGVVVRAVLARPNPFPGSYVLLLGLAAAFCAICPIAVGLLQEPRGQVQERPQLAWREYIPQVASILRHDRRFAWLTVTGWLATLADMGSAFYVLYAADRLHIPQSTIGLFISAGVAGGLLSGIVLGPLGDRKGSAAVITVTMFLRCLCPALALLAPHLAAQQPGLAPAIFLAIFCAMGMVGGAYMIGFTNYMLEIAPEGERPLYVALSQSLGIVVVAAPLFAGWLVQAASYEALYVVTLSLAAAGLAVALRRPARRVQLEPQRL